MLLESLGDILPRLCNAGLPDADAEKMIDDACQLAAAEVRQRLTHARKIELDNQALCRERQATQQAEALANQTRLESERQDGLRRQAELKAAEDRNGPRRGHLGSGW